MVSAEISLALIAVLPGLKRLSPEPVSFRGTWRRLCAILASHEILLAHRRRTIIAYAASDRIPLPGNYWLDDYQERDRASYSSPVTFDSLRFRTLRSVVERAIVSRMEYAIIAPATEEHPRNDSASIVELQDRRLDE